MKQILSRIFYPETIQIFDKWLLKNHPLMWRLRPINIILPILFTMVFLFIIRLINLIIHENNFFVILCTITIYIINSIIIFKNFNKISEFPCKNFNLVDFSGELIFYFFISTMYLYLIYLISTTLLFFSKIDVVPIYNLKLITLLSFNAPFVLHFFANSKINSKIEKSSRIFTIITFVCFYLTGLFILADIYFNILFGIFVVFISVPLIKTKFQTRYSYHWLIFLLFSSISVGSIYILKSVYSDGLFMMEPQKNYPHQQKLLTIGYVFWIAILFIISVLFRRSQTLPYKE